MSRTPYLYRLLSLLALVVALAATGCDGCDDSTAGQPGANNGQTDAGDTDPGGDTDSDTATCDDADGDGFSAGAGCQQSLDCDDTDQTVNPNVGEVCGDGVDNNCDGSTDEGCTCTPGETRECSSDVGACQLGTQTCEAAGQWGGCDGVMPQAEACDGVDNDCDGDVDENGDALCDNGVKCDGQETCSAGACVPGDPVDCTQLNGPCYTGTCLEKDGSCAAVVIEDGTSCDDGNFCTVNGVCQAGVCETTARDCSGEADQCNAGVCDEDADACVKDPTPLEGQGCDDGMFCTVGDTCQAGSCEPGGQLDCSGEDDQCNEGVCDETADSCVKNPTPFNGQPCQDGQFCTAGDVCQAGVCESGTNDPCSAGGGACIVGTCNETADACEGQPVDDGTGCDDGDFCTVSDSCVSGVCQGGGPQDCSAKDEMCKQGVCDSSLGRCIADPAPKNGDSCDDGRFCTNGETCQAGSCGSGSPVDCSGLDDQCNTGVCDDTVDSCVKNPAPHEGDTCADGLFCTTNDTCQSGSCVGPARSCASQTNQCNTGVCDESLDQCVADPTPHEGDACDDGQFCTSGDACSSGTCGGSTRDCSTAGGGDPCLIPYCDESGNQCATQYDNTCCDNTVDADLDAVGQCDDCDDTNGAIYPGATEYCNGLDDDCDGGIDEDFDMDSDGYSVCSNDPAVFDCDDSRASVHPGATEQCNGIDDDCDGYVDEGCGNCSNADQDGDGVSECGGDCDDSDPNTFPGATEICDGNDNDCNIYTRPNCEVSDPCNIDGDGDPSNDPDVCADDMICACEVNASGSCTGNYLCTAYCNSSQTGPIEDTCAADQTCKFDLLRSANIHGCGVTTDIPGSLTGGEPCSQASDCRSLICDKICRGPGCNQDYCMDFCGSDAYCPASGTTCRLSRSSSNMDGRCWPDSGPLLGTKAVGEQCSSDSECDHGFCATDPNTGSSYCSEPCCKDTDCPGSFSCSWMGDQIDTTYVFPPDDSISCSQDSDCTGQGGVCYNNACAWRITETSPMCIKDVSGQGSRSAGQSCTRNDQCASNFCDAMVGVCVQACCNDSTCPTGLTCEAQMVESADDRVSRVRICVNLTREGDVWERR